VKLGKNLGRAMFLVLATVVATQMVWAQASKKKEAASAVPDWGQFRGPKRDGLSPDTGLLKQWPKDGPPLAWKQTGLGGGFSSVVVAGKFLYTLGEINGAACLIALSAADGKVLWKSPIGDKGGNNGAGPRSTPATDGTLVFALGQEGTLVCVQAATGKEVWRKHMSDFGGQVMSGWGYSESPLIDGPMLVVTPGGNKGTVAALNKMNGAPVWQSGELKDKAPYCSLVPADFGNIPQYVVFTDQNVAGVASKTGQVLWKSERKGQTAICSSPVLSKEGTVFVSSAYGVGHNAFQVSFGGGAFKAQQIYDGKFESHHGGMVLVGDHVYGLDGGSLRCIELKTGKVAWQDRCVGKGSIAYADGALYCRSESKGGGAIALVEANPAAYKELGRFTPPTPSGVDQWANPVVFGGRMYIRDQDQLFCYAVSGK
jgi:outer membrane protein assembly factor BamB